MTQAQGTDPDGWATFALFVGFHNIVPWDMKQRHLLCLEADEDAAKGSPASVGLIDLDDPERHFRPVAKTSAWTYHVGARQQWVYDDDFLYNTVRHGRYVAVFHSVSAGPQDEIEGGIWSITVHGRWGLAPSFARSDRYYASYGFTGGTAPSLDDPVPADDGLYLVDVAGKRRSPASPCVRLQRNPTPSVVCRSITAC